MLVRSAEFVGAIGKPGQPPPATLAEVAFAGRSNVGKSSLINAVLGRKKLARVSKSPGRTREINFFRINDRFHLVDLPGYGYAQAPKEVRRGWGPLVESYLGTSGELRGVVILVDARRGLGEADRQLLNFVADFELPVLIALTKIDKLNRSERMRVIAAVRQELDLPDEQVLATSARTREGTRELLESIDYLLSSEG